MQSRDNAKLMREAATLTQELNELRREARDIDMQRKVLFKTILDRGIDPEAVGFEDAMEDPSLSAMVQPGGSASAFMKGQTNRNGSAEGVTELEDLVAVQEEQLQMLEARAGELRAQVASA
uniref:Uncharacterized protein n=2 Tax=Phaeomonas parva TaxID=124430 RepID=A0A7S1TQY7_9STRA|mmetsp:Transcript_13841/g.41098  ORF Transcript_13841/g.41098 Transcript_13841/m.41098 type:complete len:121 (+) Transcript_13841:260-622(+)